MAVQFPEEASSWAERLQSKLNDREGFAEAAAGFDATFRFDVLPDDDYAGDPVSLTVVVTDGACVAAAGRDPEADYDFALSGPYGAWVDLLEDELDVSTAVMGGRFEFQGPTAALLQHREAVAELVRAARSVDATFEG